ncbi:MFS transporter [Oceanobacillus piezotolerans]|uniref:MFS transporter n=1 Tax=Oceanobacillus piezotolerans TaxID=2448030 RepID=A0A498D4C4_9BACI|nr:MFS transporter [Oceanobacillus piezotolerans]RLL42809.1 MFS transporter [Oceanobacillus piezotolerans]
MWFANFFVAGSMTMVIPFLSLYIHSFGNFTDSYVQTWSGLTFAVTFVTAFIFAPIWGRIGDKYGKKYILIISAVGIGISVFLMGFATNVWQLFLLRLFMGIVTGFIPMSQAFISTQTPKEVAGRVLGTLQTGNITGSLLGPMLGGLLADTFSYAATFKWVSVTIFVSALLVIFVQEVKLPLSKDKRDYQSYSSKEVILHILHKPVLLVVLVLSTLVQIAHFSIQPILSLFVEEINGPQNIAFFAGIAFSAAGLGNLLMSRSWGKFGDSHGHIKILIVLLFASGIIYLPGAFVTDITQLIIIRFLLGVTIGGIVPLRIAYIRGEAPLSMQGEVIGYNTSLRFLGNVIGPALGGLIAALYGFSTVFFFTSALLILAGLLMLFTWYRYEYADKHSVSSHSH